MEFFIRHRERDRVKKALSFLYENTKEAKDTHTVLTVNQKNLAGANGVPVSIKAIISSGLNTFPRLPQ